ncbi:hypothetical protein HPB50_015260 [Hyalomma asiaticum]|uniref:Uncharacterized protein n=1 Tax=Hyalomma asiaticum TaxID=266040 RepID=A0ACB7RNS9_HYAAI|nr:hypothetical protein HPB50_015260 [Hyalomma asiaticum]
MQRPCAPKPVAFKIGRRQRHRFGGGHQTAHETSPTLAKVQNDLNGLRWRAPGEGLSEVARREPEQRERGELTRPQSSVVPHISENENQAAGALFRTDAVPASTDFTSIDFEALSNAEREDPELTEMRRCSSSRVLADTLPRKLRERSWLLHSSVHCSTTFTVPATQESARHAVITLRAIELSMCDISAIIRCLAERSKIRQPVTGKYANAMRVSNSTAQPTARPTFFRIISSETRAPNLRQTVPKGDAASVRVVRSTPGQQLRNARVAVASGSTLRD